MTVNKTNTSLHRRPAVAFIAIASLLVIAAAIYQSATKGPSAKAPDYHTLQQELQSIVPPNAATLTRGVETTVKPQAELVSVRYSSSQGEEAIVAFYRTQLASLGWAQGHDFEHAGHRGVSYCKGKLMAVLEMLDSNSSGTYFDFAISWNEKTERECP